MFIGIDASRAVLTFRRGCEQYSFYLIKALSKIDSRNQYLLYSPKPSKELCNLPSNFKWRIIPFPYLWTQIRLSFEMMIRPPDILFVPSHVLPIIHPQKTVLTIHDLGYRYYPSVYPLFSRLYENLSLRLAEKAAKIIVPSRATKDDLVRFTKIDPQKIVVIYHGYEGRIYKPQKNFFHPPFPYLLFLGRLEEKKNIIGLITAYRFLKKDPKIKHKLVLIGQPGYGYQKIKQCIKSLPAGIKKDILELGYLSVEKAAEWLSGADVFVFISFFEGFGLPLLEAMACGVPVVASSIPALREIGKDAVMFVEPNRPDKVADSIKKILTSKKIKDQMIRKGFERVKNFSWEKSAQKTLEVFESLGERGDFSKNE